MIVSAIAMGLAFTEKGRLGLAMAGYVLSAVVLVAGFGILLSVRCVTELLALRFLSRTAVVAVGAPVALWIGCEGMALRQVFWLIVSMTVFCTLTGWVAWRRARLEFERYEPGAK